MMMNDDDGYLSDLDEKEHIKLTPPAEEIIPLSYSDSVIDEQPEPDMSTHTIYSVEFNKLNLTPKTFIQQQIDKLGKSIQNIPYTDETPWYLQNNTVGITEEQRNLREKYGWLCVKYGAMADYVDKVHDVRYCKEYVINNITNKWNDANEQYFASDKNRSELQLELESIRKRLCANVGTGLINVAESHVLEHEIVNNFISDIRELGFVIPGVDDPIQINRDNPIEIANLSSNLLNGSANVGCESGREIRNFLSETFEKTESNNTRLLPKQVSHNQIGAIDGCVSSCETGPTTNTPRAWKCALNGYMSSIVISNYINRNNTRPLISTIFIVFEDKDVYVFKVIGEIKLDHVASLINTIIPDTVVYRKGPPATNNISYVGMLNNSNNNLFSSIAINTLKSLHSNIWDITSNTESISATLPVITPQKDITLNSIVDKSRLISAIEALKLLCDKRFLDRITTDYASVDQQLTAISTTDWYVFFGYLIAYLAGASPYCPDVYYSGGNSDGYLIYSFKSGNNVEMQKKFGYYKWFQEQIANNNAQWGYTDKFFNIHELRLRNINYKYSSLWEYFETKIITQTQNKWIHKKTKLKESVDDVTNALSRLESNVNDANKEDVLNALSKIPTTIPNMTEEINDIYNLADVSYFFKSALEGHTRMELNTAAIQSLPSSLSAAKAYEKALLLSDKTEDLKSTVTGFTNKFVNVAKSFDVNVKLMNRLLYKTDPLKIQWFTRDNIIVNDDGIILQFESTQKNVITDYVNEYNKNADEIDHMYLINKDNKVYVKLRLTPELLINVLFFLPPAQTSRLNEPRQLTQNDIIAKLFQLTHKLLGVTDNENSKSEFVTHILKELEIFNNAQQLKTTKKRKNESVKEYSLKKSKTESLNTNQSKRESNETQLLCDMCFHGRWNEYFTKYSDNVTDNASELPSSPKYPPAENPTQTSSFWGLLPPPAPVSGGKSKRKTSRNHHIRNNNQSNRRIRKLGIITKKHRKCNNKNKILRKKQRTLKYNRMSKNAGRR